MAKKLFTWGGNGFGTAANGNLSIVTNPTLVSSNWDKISLQRHHGLGLKDGKLYGWGGNYFGELGSEVTPLPLPPDPVTGFTPVQLGNFSDCTDIAAGSLHSLIIRNGKLYSSGANMFGQLGNGQTETTEEGSLQYEFVQVGTDTDWAKVFTANASSYAIKTNGDLYVWGLNEDYELGIPKTYPDQIYSPQFALTLTPTKINNQSWEMVSGAGTSCLGISEGRLFVWGSNQYYSLGLGNDSLSTDFKSEPFQIGTANNWQKVVNGTEASFAIKTNGTLWTAGSNGFYYTGLELSAGSTKEFTQVNEYEDWEDVAATGYAAVGIRNGNFYAWGANIYNGSGFETDYTEAPAPVETGQTWTNFYPGEYTFAGLAIDTSPPSIDEGNATVPGTLPKVGDQISTDIGGEFNGGDTNYQWQKKPPGGEWVNIPGATDPNYNPGTGDVDSEIRVIIEVENEYGSDTYTSPSLGIVRSAFSTENWRFLFHEIDGTTIGEFTDLNNFRLNVGLNKNSDLSFDTTLKSNLGQMLADSLDSENPVVLVTAWRYDPYDQTYKVQFSGPIFSIEETGSDDNPTIGVTAVGGYYRLTKRIANNDANQGRRQSGLSPTLDTLELLVTDNTGNRVMVFNGKTGAYIRKWGTAGAGDGEFSNIHGIAVGPQNYVYVADRGNNRIQKFALDGTFISKWSTTHNNTTYLNNPVDVAVDQSSGDVWVADRGNKQVVKYDSDGTFIFRVQATLDCPMDNLRGISVDFEGNAYLADETDLTTNPNNQGVYKITPTGEIIVETTGIIASYQKKFALDPGGQAYWVNGAGVLRKGPGRPKLTSRASTMRSSSIGQSVILGPDRSVYFLESNNTDTSKVTRYNPANNQAKVIGAYGTADGQTRNAKGIALARSGARDAVEIIDEIITESNDRDGHSWIEPAATQGEGTQLFVQPGSLGGFRTVASLIEEFNQNYEWEIIPKFEESGGNLLLGEWHADAVIGSNKATDGSVIFEYGLGRFNVDSYTIKKTIEGLANKINYPVSDTIPYNVTSISKDSISQIGLFEDSLTGNIVDTDLRKKLTDLHLFYRTLPRLLVEITPTRSDQSGPDNTRVPIPLLEYRPGDIIGIEVKDGEVERLPAAEARIYDMTVELDSEGRETCSLNLYLD